MNPQQPYQQYPPQQPGWPGPTGQHSGGHPYPSGGYHPPAGQPWPPMPPAPKKHRKWPWVVSGLAVVLLLIMVIAAAGSRTPGTTTSPSGLNPNAQPAAAGSAPQAAGPAKAIAARDWARIAKDPASHVGESIIVYGEVTQFDSVTGTNAFRANVDGVKHPVSYGFADYKTNTILTGDGADLGDLVEGDLFQAETVVAGAISYENTMGGSLTAPKLTVTKIKVIGSTK